MAGLFFLYISFSNALQASLRVSRAPTPFGVLCLFVGALDLFLSFEGVLCLGMKKGGSLAPALLLLLGSLPCQ